MLVFVEYDYDTDGVDKERVVNGANEHLIELEILLFACTCDK